MREMIIKTAIVYVSTHHGNKKKLVDAISEKYDITVIDGSTPYFHYATV